mmetsp:Transcript_6241/g.15530  ORF Transcript_6241/g.15530 Transcript_6241/m.15530 type:complete len:228 (+) Transcript_6241:318-1001(+)
MFILLVQQGRLFLFSAFPGSVAVVRIERRQNDVIVVGVLRPTPPGAALPARGASAAPAPGLSPRLLDRAAPPIIPLYPLSQLRQEREHGERVLGQRGELVPRHLGNFLPRHGLEQEILGNAAAHVARATLLGVVLGVHQFVRVPQRSPGRRWGILAFRPAALRIPPCRLPRGARSPLAIGIESRLLVRFPGGGVPSALVLVHLPARERPALALPSAAQRQLRGVGIQ